MSDFFADLRAGLLEAVERDSRRSPLRRLVPRAGAAARAVALAAAVAAAVATISLFAAGGSPDRAGAPAGEAENLPPGADLPTGDLAAPPGVAPGDIDPHGPSCTEDWRSRPTEGAVPDELTGMLALFRRAATAEDRPKLEPLGPQVIRFYEDGSRLARRAGDRAYYAVAAEIIRREDVRETPCTKARGPGEPGVCLAATDGRGQISACFAAAEIRDGHAPLDITRPGDADEAWVVGLAPDGAREAVFELGEEDAVLPVEENVYAGRVGANAHVLVDADVSFRP